MDVLFLSKTLLFRGTTPQEVQSILECLQAEKKHYQKSDVIYHAGDSVTSLGMVLSGSVSIENDDLWGNKSILDRIGPGQVFAETYACVSGEALMVSVVAAEASDILFMNVSRLLRICPHACEHHGKLIRNLLTISAQKNLNLSRRIFHTSSKSIRGRLLSYLSFQAVRQGRRDFTIPFNRQQLADYLSACKNTQRDRRFLRLRLPKAVQIAVFIGGDHFVVLADPELRNRSGARTQLFALIALLGLQRDPHDVVLVQHGVLHGTHRNGDLRPLHLHHRDVLFIGGIRGVGDQLLHGLAAANHRYPGVLDIGDDVMAMAAFIKFHGKPSFQAQARPAGGRAVFPFDYRTSEGAA